MPIIHPVSLIIAVVLLAWPGEIGADRPMPPPAVNPPAASGPKALAPLAHKADKRYKQQKLEPAFDARLDKARFLAIFKRQAEAELMGCLHKWRTAESSLLLAADLTKEGKLININFLGAQPPPCAMLAIAAMDFSQLTTHLAGSSLVVQWRIDW